MLKAGSIEKAAGALRAARHARCGNAMGGVQNVRFAQWLEPDHAEYLQEMATSGVPTRRLKERHRIRSRPHPSATQHLHEMYEKAWKDSNTASLSGAVGKRANCSRNLWSRRWAEFLRCYLTIP